MEDFNFSFNNYSKETKGRLVPSINKRKNEEFDKETEYLKSWQSFVNKVADGDETVANAIVSDYFNSDLNKQDMIIFQCSQKCSCRELKPIFNIGSQRYYRNKTGIQKKKCGGTKLCFTEEDINLFKKFILSLDVEKGFPCQHRRLKHYIIEEGISWTTIYYRLLIILIIIN